jgi:hypothetical protein
MSHLTPIPTLRFPFCSVSIAVVSLWLAQSCFAQNSEVDRAQLVRTQPTFPASPSLSSQGLDDGHAAASPNDPDLGEQQILKRADQYQPFSVSVGSPFYYTSNVALTRSGEHGDFLLAPVAAVSYDPRFCKTFFGHLGVRQQFFLYDRFDEFNFASFDAEAGISYYVPQWHNLALHAQYIYTRFTDTDDFDEFFSNHALYFNAEIPFRLSRAQQISLGADTSVSIGGDPEEPRRHDFGFYIGYAVNLTRSFSLDAAGRIVVRNYVGGDRRDVSEMLALSANYRVASWLTASAISSFAASQSNHSIFDYEVFNIGGAISLTAKF